VVNGAEWRRILMPEFNVASMKFERADPILNVRSMAQSLEFYVNMLGFVNASWGDDRFTCVSRDNAQIYLCERDQGQPGTWVWIGVEDVEVLYTALVEKGATILQPPEHLPWACEMRVQDPNGHILRFGSDPK
jgi:predicted enzyme related to lactoylglutathione lyase